MSMLWHKNMPVQTAYNGQGIFDHRCREALMLDLRSNTLVKFINYKVDFLSHKIIFFVKVFQNILKFILNLDLI